MVRQTSTTSNSSAETHSAHRVLIGAPLALVLMFSFGFVLLHPAEVGRAGLTTTNQQTAATSHTDSATASLPPIPLAPTTLPTLTPVPQTEDASQAGNTAHETATPQVVGTASPAASRSLQAAGPSGQSISSNKPINTRMSLPTPLLTNLFRH